jgi:hypothetical protein
MMTYKPHAGEGLIFMKVGTHARETLKDILARKQKELSEAGVSFWGYGGNTCHPTTKVQPFVSRLVGEGREVYLCMQEMVSNHFAEPIRATEYSEDGVTWKAVPDPINVLGSRYALVLKSLDKSDFDLSLARTRVGVGLQQGRSGVDYISGRVDKACLELTDEPQGPAAEDKVLKISLAAQLAAPYAVLLR